MKGTMTVIFQGEQKIVDRPWHAQYEPQVPVAPEIPNVTLHEMLERTVRDYPNNTATIFFGKRLTYAQLDEHANRFAAGLQSLGVRRGDKVALILPNCPQFIIALYGTLKAGAVVLPTNPLYVQRELRGQFNDAGVETVVALNIIGPRVQEIMPETSVKRLIVTHMRDYLSPLMGVALSVKEKRDASGVLVQGEGVYSFVDLIKSNPPEYERSDATPDDMALFLYTGGTTGTPKGAMLSHRNVVANTVQMSSWVWDARRTARSSWG
jgi:long-chain acyl-CoA synthetase